MFVNISVLLFCECRFIRVVGTHNTVNKVFHLVALECMYTQRPFTLEKGILGNVVFLIPGSYKYCSAPETHPMSPCSSHRERCNCAGLCECDRGCESLQERPAERGHQPLWLGLGIHLPPAGLWSHRYPARSALHAELNAVRELIFRVQ